MKKKRRDKKIFNLIAICSFCAILLSVSTYAWFIGMKTVSVNKFDVEIATTEGLFLSMDGKNWKYQLDAKKEEAYSNNANQWLTEDGEGLIPMSSVGDMDSTTSRMKLYQKASLTSVANGGGYRLMAKQVDNNSRTKVVTETHNEYLEADGYVAFDLFVMNLSGDEYYTDNNILNEEAIYLTTNSAVTVGSGGKENTGIENSIRVGVVQLGRVNAELDLNDRTNGGKTSQPIITSITCANSEGTAKDLKEKYVTGICRDASIWEPNDTAHTDNAIKWYNKGCLKRTGTDVTANESYVARSEDGLTTCSPISNGTAYPTYAISTNIDFGKEGYNDNVNVYDGLAYNQYKANTTTYAEYLKADKTGAKLVEMNNFTDTMKNKLGTARPQFMSLAPNSITKLRVYIWLEGQDIDNYDFAQLGKQVKINFGFTKERFTETDVSHNGPTTELRSLPYTEATGAIVLDPKAISDGVTYDATLKIFTAPKTVSTFDFTDDGAGKTATFDTLKNIWNVREKQI